MSVEIKEMVIQTHIMDHHEQVVSQEEIDQIIEECTAKVEVLRQKNEW